MKLVDFALQGLAGLRTAALLKFGPTLTATASDPVEPGVLARALIEGMYSQGFDPAAAQWAGYESESFPVAVSFSSADGCVFRVVRDLKRGSAQLMRREDSGFVPVTTSASEIDQFFRGRIGAPERNLYERMFVIDAEGLPSRRVSSNSLDAAGVPATPQPLHADEKAAIEKRVEFLRRSVQAHETVETLEYELDGLQNQLFALETKIARLDMDTTAVDEAQNRCTSLQYLEILPSDFPLKVEHYQEAVQRQERDFARWTEERDTLERDARTIRVEPVAREWRMWSGIAIGTVALVAGFWLRGPSQLIALLDIPAFGVSTFMLWRHLSVLEARDNNRRRLELSDRRKELIATRDEQDIREVEALLEQIGRKPNEAEEALKAIEGLQVARAELESAQRAYHAAMNNPELRRLKDEHDALRKRIGDLETQLSTSSLGGEAVTVRHEIKELEQKLSGEVAERPVSPPRSLSVTPDPPMRGFLESAVELLLMPRDESSAQIEGVASRILRKLTNGQVESARLNVEGHVVVSVGSTERDLLNLPSSTQDVVYLALRAGLLLSLTEKMRAPVLIVGLDHAVPWGTPFIVAFASMLAQHIQTVCISHVTGTGWPERTTFGSLRSG